MVINSYGSSRIIFKRYFNFLGVQEVFVVRAEGMAFPTRSQSISQAINSIPQMFAMPAQN